MARLARKLRVQYPGVIYQKGKGVKKVSVPTIVEFALTLSCPCLFSATWREDSEFSTSALAVPSLAQLQLRVLEKVVVLQDPDDLEQVQAMEERRGKDQPGGWEGGASRLVFRQRAIEGTSPGEDELRHGKPSWRCGKAGNG